MDKPAADHHPMPEPGSRPTRLKKGMSGNTMGDRRFVRSCLAVFALGLLLAAGTSHATPPPSGACCLPDYTCAEMSQADCESAGGTFQGDWTVCDPSLCLPPPPTGACCITSESECTPELCSPTPTEPSSWGQVKDIYR